MIFSLVSDTNFSVLAFNQRPQKLVSDTNEKII